MNIQESSFPIKSSTTNVGGAIADSAAAQNFWRRMGAAIERAGEYLNPLLVKEVRQSLKSRQFSFTFTLVLCVAWAWSIGGIVHLGPSVSYGANGPEMFYGYYLILAFPLLLVVPYSAYRSLIAEREDNTYELIAITALKPRQIVGGKLGCAVAQMMVYASAVAPCLAFTYLLRGIDVLAICWILFYTFLASLGFSLCALLFATAAKEKQWQIAYAVLIIIGLFTAFSRVVQLCHDVLRAGRLPFDSLDFWIANLAVQTAFWSTFALLYVAAGAQLTFTADNRSTSLRIAMFVQHGLFAGWIGYYFFRSKFGIRNAMHIPSGDFATLYMAISCFYWYLMGSFLLGEATELSARVKRGLPKTFLGRMFFTWFNPGPGTGYLFAVSNAVAAVLLATIVVIASDPSATAGIISGVTNNSRLLTLFVLTLGYFIFYLGVANLLLRLIRLLTSVTLSSAVLVNFLLVFAAWGIPKVIREATDPRGFEYTLLHVTDPIWSCYVVTDLSTAPIYSADLLWRVLPAAAAVLLVNLVYIVPEVRQVRQSPPARVEEEEIALAPMPASNLQPANPWD